MRIRLGLACLGLLALGAVAGAGAPIPVRPGTVVRWAGESLVECRLGEDAFAPDDGACFFPIDLEASGRLAVSRRGARGVERRELAVGGYPYAVEQLQVEEKYVAPSPAELERIAREKARVAALWRLATPRRFALPLAAPLAEMSAASRFGERRVFNGEPRSPHSGADFKAAPGTLVFAPADGRVALAEEQFFAGNAVYLDHGDGLVSMAFHLEQILVRAGDEVKRGQPIGRVGATGRVTGPHLHFGLRWHGARIDPVPLFGAVTDLATLD